MAAQREAARRGADDVVFVSSDGYVLEAPTASVVWCVGRTLHTTPLGATGILGGTTQQLLFERAAAAGWRPPTRWPRVDDLHAADVVWLISSVRGPVDVVELDGTKRARRPDIDAEIRAPRRLLSAAVGKARCRAPHARRTVDVHERGGGPELSTYRTREVASS